MVRNFLKTAFSAVNIILYIVLMLPLIAFPILLFFPYIFEANLYFSTIYYYLLSGQIELFLLLVILLLFFFIKIIRREKVYYLFSSLLLIANCIFDVLTWNKPLHAVGIIVKLLIAISFFVEGWRARGDYFSKHRKNLRFSVCWGSVLFFAGFLQYMLLKFEQGPILIFAVAILFVVGQAIWFICQHMSARDVGYIWLGSTFVWGLLSSWLSLLLYKPFPYWFDVSEDYMNEKFWPFFVFQILHLVTMGIVWCIKARGGSKKTERNNTGDDSLVS